MRRVRASSFALLALSLVMAGCGGTPTAVAPTAPPTAQTTAVPAKPAESKPAEAKPAGPAGPAQPAESKPAAAAPAQKVDRVKVRIGYIPVDAMGALFVAAEKFLPEENIEPEMVKLQSGAEILTQVTTGDLQVGQGALGGAAFNALSRGLPAKVVGPGHGEYPGNSFFVNKDIKGPDDARGKKFAINAKGVATEVLLDEALKKWNLSLKDVEVVTMPFPDMPAALESGAIVGGAFTEPIATIAEQKGIGYRPFPNDPAAPAIPTTVLWYNADWAAKNEGGVADRFMNAFLKAARSLDGCDGSGQGWNSEEALRLRAQYTGISPDLLKVARATKIDKNLFLDVDELQRQQRFHQELGYLQYETLIEPSTWLDNSFVERALQKAGRC